jgi:IS30 family transposase
MSGWLKIRYPDDESMRVSHETIYRSLFIQARGVLKKERMGHLRSKRRIRRSRHARIFKDSRGRVDTFARHTCPVIQHDAGFSSVLFCIVSHRQGARN